MSLPGNISAIGTTLENFGDQLLGEVVYAVSRSFWLLQFLWGIHVAAMLRGVRVLCRSITACRVVPPDSFLRCSATRKLDHKQLPFGILTPLLVRPLQRWSKSPGRGAEGTCPTLQSSRSPESSQFSTSLWEMMPKARDAKADGSPRPPHRLCRGRLSCGGTRREINI